jgi:hypothetical protein
LLCLCWGGVSWTVVRNTIEWRTKHRLVAYCTLTLVQLDELIAGEK